MSNVGVLIKSCQKYAARREACRATWLTRCTLPYVFVIGDPACTLLPGAEDELVIHGVPDDFRSIAPKLCYGLRYMIDEGADYIFVCDDDTYVDCVALIEDLPDGCDYVGHMRTDGIEYNGDIPYASGSAFWLSRCAAAIVTDSGLMVASSPENHVLDDCTVGRALDGTARFVHNRRYWPGPVPKPLAGTGLISMHKCLPRDMIALHQSLEKEVGRS